MAREKCPPVPLGTSLDPRRNRQFADVPDLIDALEEVESSASEDIRGEPLVRIERRQRLPFENLSVQTGRTSMWNAPGECP